MAKDYLPTNKFTQPGITVSGSKVFYLSSYTGMLYTEVEQRAAKIIFENI